MSDLSTSSSLSGSPAVAGLVEKFDAKEIYGWVDLAPGQNARLTLFLNDIQVASSPAVAPIQRVGHGTCREFRFNLKDVWNYARTTDRLTVRCGDTILPIAGRGFFRVPGKSGDSRPEVLKERLAQGFVFNQKGLLQLSKAQDPAWKGKVHALYERISAVLEKEFGYRIFVVYGTLLGTVRQGDFIGHDHDFDTAYISRHTDGAAVRAEVQAVARALLASGLRFVPRRTCLWVYDPREPKVTVDVFHLRFDETGQLAFSFGVAGTAKVDRATVASTKPAKIGDYTVAVPENAETVLELLYGPYWRTPNPGFNWAIEKKASDAATVLRDEDVTELYWLNFYTHETLQNPSPFAQFLASSPRRCPVVVDLGCGDGVDAAAFIGAGSRVVGFDKSSEAIIKAGERARAAGVADKHSSVLCDLGDEAALKAALSQHVVRTGNEKVLFYARFFFHAVPSPTEQVVLKTIASFARPGDIFAAEFRTLEDEKCKKHFSGKHRRRFIKTSDFIAALTKQGFALEIEQSGNGLAPFRDEDPRVARIVAKKT